MEGDGRRDGGRDGGDVLRSVGVEGWCGGDEDANGERWFMSEYALA